VLAPICSFAASISPPLWQQSETIVILQPLGTYSTSILKSSSVAHKIQVSMASRKIIQGNMKKNLYFDKHFI